MITEKELKELEYHIIHTFDDRHLTPAEVYSVLEVVKSAYILRTFENWMALKKGKYDPKKGLRINP